jgi:hypothetical protein
MQRLLPGGQLGLQLPASPAANPPGRLAERIVSAADEGPNAVMALARDPDVVKWAHRAQMPEPDEDPELWPSA